MCCVSRQKNPRFIWSAYIVVIVRLNFNFVATARTNKKYWGIQWRLLIKKKFQKMLSTLFSVLMLTEVHKIIELSFTWVGMDSKSCEPRRGSWILNILSLNNYLENEKSKCPFRLPYIVKIIIIIIIESEFPKSLSLSLSLSLSFSLFRHLSSIAIGRSFKRYAVSTHSWYI